MLMFTVQPECYGNPLDRDAEQVNRDVADGVVSRQAARDVFGVVVSDDPDAPELDVEATVQLRAELRERSRPLVDPTTPGASTWIRDNIADGDKLLLNPKI